jgi:hypothetical protein
MKTFTLRLSRFVVCAILALGAGVVLRTGAEAQAPAVIEPETLGVVYLRDPGSGALLSLDREVSHVKASPGFFKAKAKLRVNGPAAKMRIKPTQKMEFIVQLANGVDPNKIKLYKLDVNGGKRETVILTVVAFSGAKAELKTLTLDVTKHGQSSYKLTPAQQLLPGEYVLVATDSTDAFCFGVEAMVP